MKINVCDLCGKFPVHNFIVRTGETEPDPAGGPREQVKNNFDLCNDHVMSAIKHLLITNDWMQEKILSEWYNRQTKWEESK